MNTRIERGERKKKIEACNTRQGKVEFRYLFNKSLTGGTEVGFRQSTPVVFPRRRVTGEQVKVTGDFQVSEYLFLS